MEKANQAKEKDPELSPQYIHKKKLIEEDQERKVNNPVVEEFIELISDHQHKKGHKVRLCKRMKNGNLHRLYLGRSKDMKEYLERWQKDGKKILR